MQADDFIKLVDNPNFISGIYNYCNRWCDKCSFVAQCTVGTMEQLIHFGRTSNEPITLDEFTGMMEIATGTSINKEDVKTITINVDELMELDEDEPSLLNDVSTSDPDSDFEAEFKAAFEFVESHEIIALAHPYSISCYKWKNHMSKYFYFDDSSENPSCQYIGKFPINSAQQKKELIEAFETVVWYVLQIEIKLKRALHGFYTDKDDYLPGDYQTDFNGSAKIAVIGINSSLQAFEKLYAFFTEEQSSIKNKMGLLESVRAKTYEQFPNLDAFKRPGFDEF
jgi:hypothetical protein